MFSSIFFFYLILKFSMSNVLPCTDKNSADSNQHGSDSVVQLEAPVVNGDLVWLNQGRDGLGEGVDEQVGHGPVFFGVYDVSLERTQSLQKSNV